MDRIAAVHEDLLRDVVPRSRTTVEVFRRLKLRASAANRELLLRRCADLGIDTSHLTVRRRSTEVLLDDLREIIVDTSSWSEVCARLGMARTGATYLRLQGICLGEGIPISHMPKLAPRVVPIPATGTRARSRYTDDDLRSAVVDAKSFADVCRRLGVLPRGANYEILKRRMRAIGLDPESVRCRSWNGGTVHGPSRPLGEYLVNGRSVASSWLLKRLVTEEVWEHRCSRCELSEWLDQPIPLELDHINGVREDNRLENLRPLCPNCHALTPTYRGRNIGRGRSDQLTAVAAG